jgi:hypothetical protein
MTASPFKIPSVTSQLALDPSKSVQELAKALFGSDGFHVHNRKRAHITFEPPSVHELDLAAQSGSFPSRPSLLFLQVSATPVGSLLLIRE